MSKIRDLLVSAPGLCGVEASIALRIGEMIGDAFDKEIANKKSVYSKLPGEDQYARLTGAFMWKHTPGVDKQKAEYCHLLATLDALIGDYSKGLPVLALADDIEDKLSEYPEYEDIDNVMTKQEAATQDFWND